MASLRLDPDSEKRLARAARKSGLSKSEFMRRCLKEKTEEVLAEKRDASAIWAEIDAIDAGEIPNVSGTDWGEVLLAKHEADMKDFLEALENAHTP
ncbi:MAG: CopG family transcriptional regulator [Dehalococcoidia bacterium]